MVYHSVELTQHQDQVIDTGADDGGYLRYLSFYTFLLIRTHLYFFTFDHQSMYFAI